MLKKLINSTSKTITSAAIVIGVLSLASGLLAFFRDRILAGTFGAGDILDVYYAAFRLPDLVYNLLILGAISAGLIPVFSSLLAQHKEKEAWKLINGVLNIMFVGLLAICALFFIFAPWLMRAITPGFPPQKMELVVRLSRIMFLSPLFLGLSAIFGSILQSYKKFFTYSLAPLFYNFGIIIGALFLVPSMGVYGLAWGVVLGAFMHMLVQLWPAFSAGFVYSPMFHWRDKNVIRVGKLMIPRTLALVISQVNIFLITIFASTLASGSLAIFNLSNNLQGLPLTIFGISMGVAALPVLSGLVAEKKMDSFVETISPTFRQVLFFIIPISVLLYVLRAQIVRVILGSGRFNWFDTRLTTACLAIFCFGLFAQSAFPLIIRGFYALHNTKTPFYIGIFTMIVNLGALLLFTTVYGFTNWFSFLVEAILRIDDLAGMVDYRVLALPSAIVVSAIFELIVLMIFLRKEIGRLDGRKIIDSVYRILFAALGAGLISYWVLQWIEKVLQTQTFVGLFTQGFVAGMAGLLGYWLLGYLLKMEEMAIFLASAKRKLLRLSKANISIEETTTTN